MYRLASVALAATMILAACLPAWAEHHLEDALTPAAEWTPPPLSSSFETMFAGFPPDTTQQNLPELQPHLLANHRLGREEGCMAAALYFEARGESEEGQLAVAQVILNRVDAKAYPDTVCEVVWQNAHMRNACQFSFTCDGKTDRVTEKGRFERIKRLSRSIIQGTWSQWAAKPTERLAAAVRLATHYHADYVSPRWAPKLRKAEKIGRHIFYVSDRVRRTFRTT